MKLLFVQSDPFAWIGKMSIAAVLKKAGHKTDVLIEPAEKNLMKSIRKVNPDIIAFSATTGVHSWSLEKAKEIKKRFNLPILFGGPHATFFPEVINDPNTDFVCMGEAEEAVLELLNKLEGGKDISKIKNLWVKKKNKIYKNPLRPLLEDLDKLPIPDRSVYFDRYSFLKNQNNKEFMFTRGCPYKCTFCYNHSLRKIYARKGRYVRHRSVDRAIEELLHVKNKWGLGSPLIPDSTMFLNKKWWSEFLERYKEEINLPLVTELRGDLANREIIRRLKEANCICIRMGVETGSDYLRNKVLKKSLTNKQIEDAARLIKKEKILLETYNMVGLPKETLKDAFKTLYINKKIKADYAWCSIFQPYPKTELGELAAKEGLIDKDFWKDLHPSFFVTTPMKLKNKKEIINLQKFFALTVEFNIPIPLIKLLIKAPNNKLYDLIFKAGYVYLTLKTTKFGIRDIYKFGKMTGNYFERKESKKRQKKY